MQPPSSCRIQVSALKPQSYDATLIKPSKTIQQGPDIPDILRVPLTKAEQKELLYRDILKGGTISGASACSEMAAVCRRAE